MVKVKVKICAYLFYVVGMEGVFDSISFDKRYSLGNFLSQKKSLGNFLTRSKL